MDNAFLHNIFQIKESFPSDVLQRDIITRNTISIQAFYIPSGESVSFSDVPGVDQLHVMMSGKCQITLGSTQLTAESGHLIGLGSPSGHELTALKDGAGFFTISLSRMEESDIPSIGGITIIDLRGTQRKAATSRLMEWSKQSVLKGRLSLIALEPRSKYFIQVFPNSVRTCIALEGTTVVETESKEDILLAPCVHEIEADIPHKLFSRNGERATLLTISDPEPAEWIVNHLACGNRINRCDLIKWSEEGLIRINPNCEIETINSFASKFLGLPDEHWKGDLSQLLMPKDANWLRSHLSIESLPEPMRTVWASPIDPAQAFSVLMIPYRGESELQQILIYLRPLIGSNQEGSLLWQQESSTLSKNLRAQDQIFHGFVSQNPRMTQIKQHILALSQNKHWVVVWGENGTGKTTVARLIHKLSGRHEQSFRTISCQELSTETLISILFGNKGIPSGESDEHLELGSGLIGLQKGTVFIEKLQALRLSVQNKILKGLLILRKPLLGDVSIIVELDHRPQKGLPVSVAGNTKLPSRGGFYTLELPALRDRPEDIPVLFYSFLQQATKTSKEIPRLSGEAFAYLIQYNFPENIYELKRLAEILAKSMGHNEISVSNLIPLLKKRKFANIYTEEEEETPTLFEAERSLLIKALRKTGGNKAEAARILGITRPRLYRMMVEYQLDNN